MKDAHAASYIRRCCCGGCCCIIIIISWWLRFRQRCNHVLRSLRRLGVDQNLINFISAKEASRAHDGRIDKRAVLGRSREMKIGGNGR